MIVGGAWVKIQYVKETVLPGLSRINGSHESNIKHPLKHHKSIQLRKVVTACDRAADESGLSSSHAVYILSMFL